MRWTPLSSCFPSTRSSLVSPPPSVRSFPGRVLVIDGDERIRAFLGKLLSTEGYEVSLAADARGAVTVVLQTRPDLALLDLRMAGSPGWHFLDLQAENPLLVTIPVLVPSEFVADFAVEGVSGNPFLLATFLEAVRRLAYPRASGLLPQHTLGGAASPGQREALDA